MLRIWEAGLAGSQATRAVRMLSAAGHTDADADADGGVETLSIGRRDALVLGLRIRLFGPRAEAVVSCPACAEELEIGFDATTLQADAPQPPAELEASAAGHTVRFRLPHTGDLRAVATFGGGTDDLAAARAALLARCVREAWDASGAEVPADALPAEVTAAVATVMELADPQAVVSVAVTCPCCGHAWTAPFDAVEFLWHELDMAAQRLLADVHRLATAYGWSEREILAMGPARRDRYLGMVHQ